MLPSMPDTISIRRAIPSERDALEVVENERGSTGHGRIKWSLRNSGRGIRNARRRFRLVVYQPSKENPSAPLIANFWHQ
jgi:hypothetical protein